MNLPSRGQPSTLRSAILESSRWNSARRNGRERSDKGETIIAIPRSVRTDRFHELYTTDQTVCGLVKVRSIDHRSRYPSRSTRSLSVDPLKSTGWSSNRQISSFTRRERNARYSFPPLLLLLAVFSLLLFFFASPLKNLVFLKNMYNALDRPSTIYKRPIQLL